MAEPLFFKKLFLFFSFLLSIPIALSYLYLVEPVYTASSVVKFKDGLSTSPKSPASHLLFGETNSLGGLFNNKSNGAPVSKMSGGVFLANFIASGKLPKDFKRYCAYKEPSSYSATKVLDLIGVLPFRYPNSQQLIQSEVKCIQKLLKISRYKYSICK